MRVRLFGLGFGLGRAPSWAAGQSDSSWQMAHGYARPGVRVRVWVWVWVWVWGPRVRVRA